jgi:hypothetical protein
LCRVRWVWQGGRAAGRPTWAGSRRNAPEIALAVLARRTPARRSSCVAALGEAATNRMRRSVLIHLRSVLPWGGRGLLAGGGLDPLRPGPRATSRVSSLGQHGNRSGLERQDGRGAAGRQTSGRRSRNCTRLCSLASAGSGIPYGRSPLSRSYASRGLPEQKAEKLCDGKL